MTWLLSILAFVVIFSVLILIHEAGHFFAARRAGVRVEEFGLGMPPKAWGYKPKHSDTTYSLNWIPFGGFVRMNGEDAFDAKALKNPHSFAAKSPGKKISIIVAGVLMNFLLAFVLLVIGFTIGIQPLLVTPADVYDAINTGVVKLQEGMIVKDVGENEIGFQAGDKVLAVNGQKIVFGDEISLLKTGETVNFEVERGGQKLALKGIYDSKKSFFKGYEVLPIPRVVVAESNVASPYNDNDLIEGDAIIKVNGKELFDFNDFRDLWSAPGPLTLSVLRSGVLRDISINRPEAPGYLISEVLADSNAQKIGLLSGDQIIAINGVKITGEEVLNKVLADKSSKQIDFKILRKGTVAEYFVDRDDQGLTGVYISQLLRLADTGKSFYVKALPFSMIKIEDIRVPFWQAPGKALEEMWRLSWLTIDMFGKVVGQVFTRFSVPEGVAGPVGIAQMTFVFVQEGFMSLLRFMALLSLSLAIINILPFPGLDGGRLMLIVLPMIFGKKLNPKMEAFINLLGFVLLMILILFITFNDVLKLF